VPSGRRLLHPDLSGKRRSVNHIASVSALYIVYTCPPSLVGEEVVGSSTAITTSRRGKSRE
jgi:hypothetical protein